MKRLSLSLDPFYFHSSSFFNGAGGYTTATFKALAHGISRAAIAQAQGQNTRSAFISGFISSGFSVGTKGYGGIAGRTMIMGTVSGTISKMTGGKFANGAMTGAFIHLFNDSAAYYATKRSLYAEQSRRERQENALDMSKTVGNGARKVATVSKVINKVYPNPVTYTVDKLSSGVAAGCKVLEYSIDRP